MADLVVSPERSGNRAVLRVHGELDLGTVAVLQEEADACLVEGGFAELVVDCGGVTFLDSTGLGALLRIRSDAADRGIGLRLQNVVGGPARVIAIAGLNSSFGIADRPSA